MVHTYLRSHGMEEEEKGISQIAFQITIPAHTSLFEGGNPRHSFNLFSILEKVKYEHPIRRGIVQPMLFALAYAHRRGDVQMEHCPTACRMNLMPHLQTCLQLICSTQTHQLVVLNR